MIVQFKKTIDFFIFSRREYLNLLHFDAREFSHVPVVGKNTVVPSQLFTDLATAGMKVLCAFVLRGAVVMAISGRHANVRWHLHVASFYALWQP